MPNITQRTLTTTRPKSVPFFIRDSKVQGFAIKVNPSGSIKYIVEIYHNGKSVRKTLGAYPVIELQDDLNEIELTDPGYKLFEKIPALKILETRNSDISDRTLVFINHLKSLEWLCLRNTEMTDEGLRHLTAPQSLQHLDLVGTAIVGPGLMHLRHLANLQNLYVSGFQHYDKWLEILRSELPQCEINLN